MTRMNVNNYFDIYLNFIKNGHLESNFFGSLVNSLLKFNLTNKLFLGEVRFIDIMYYYCALCSTFMTVQNNNNDEKNCIIYIISWEFHASHKKVRNKTSYIIVFKSDSLELLLSRIEYLLITYLFDLVLVQ